MAARYLLALLALSSFVLQQFAVAAPTDGFTQQTFRYTIQKPYDKSLSQRYSYQNGVHTMWVFSNDQPFVKGSPTKPRTEMRIQGVDYTSGVSQFEGEFYVPSTSTGMAIMQVMGNAKGVSAAMQLRVAGGNLVAYGGAKATVGSGIYNRWVHLNVIHNADAKQMQVYLNGVLRLKQSNGGIGNHYFKCGVYMQNNSSSRMESRWQHIKIWKQRPDKPMAALEISPYFK